MRREQAIVAVSTDDAGLLLWPHGHFGRPIVLHRLPPLAADAPAGGAELVRLAEDAGHRGGAGFPSRAGDAYECDWHRRRSDRHILDRPGIRPIPQHAAGFPFCTAVKSLITLVLPCSASSTAAGVRACP